MRTILDLGSRDGRLFSELIKPGKMRGLEFKNYFGIELDVDSFKLLQQRLSYDSTAHAILGDITKLDEAIYRFQKDIESPVICIMQNTLGTIEGDGNWENVILQLKLLLDKFKNSEIILSLYKAVQPECSVDQIKKVLEIIEQHENSDLRSGQDRLQEAIKLLGNGWLLPSYLYTKSQNGWPPDPDMLKQGKLSIPTSGYVSRQWTESDIGDILELLEAKIIDRNESEEFAVLRLSR